MERSQFWGCQHISILSNPSCQAGLSGGGVEVGERERSSGAIPGHQEVFTHPSWLGYNMKGWASWSQESLKAYNTLLLSSVTCSLCVKAGQRMNGQREFPTGPSAAVVMKARLNSSAPYIRMQLYHSWQLMEAQEAAHLLCRNGLTTQAGLQLFIFIILVYIANLLWPANSGAFKHLETQPTVKHKNTFDTYLNTNTQLLQYFHKITFCLIPCDALWYFHFWYRNPWQIMTYSLTSIVHTILTGLGICFSFIFSSQRECKPSKSKNIAQARPCIKYGK